MKKTKIMTHGGKLFSVIAVALIFCAEVSAQDTTTTIDSLQQVIETQRQVMEEHQARLDAIEKSKGTQTENGKLDQIWKQRKHFTIGIGSQNLTNKDKNSSSDKQKSTTALSMQMGKTFDLHKKPLANMVKIGLDWDYIDFHYAKYESTGAHNDASGWKWHDEDDYDYGYGDDIDDVLGLTNLGYHQIDYGTAIGPKVQVTPFYNIGKGFEHIKVYTHFHVIPSFSGLLFSENDETNFGYGYVTNFSWGIGISWRFIAFGFETRWGSGKYDMSAFNDDDDLDMSDLSSLFKSDKAKYKTTNSKFTISLRW